MLPPELISASLLICQSVLKEDAGTFSLIRLIDAATIHTDPSAGPQSLPLELLFLARAKPGTSSDTEYDCGLHVERPDGTTTRFGNAKRKFARLGDPVLPHGMNVYARFGLPASTQGLYYFFVTLDGLEVARAPFVVTIEPRTAQQEG
jgi:hypothetical protein